MQAVVEHLNGMVVVALQDLLFMVRLMVQHIQHLV
jgi:hypothetical protein